MTLLNTYPTETEAYIDKGMLEAHGINCVVQSDALSSIYPAPLAGTSTASLYVESDKAEEALALLKEHHDL